MTQNRMIPFGYMMKNGRITIHPEESIVVVQIFNDYLSGKSLQDLVEQMQIPYSEHTEWNFKQIWHILNNQKYLGTEIYPQLIESEIFEAVQKLKSSKATFNNKVPEHIAEIRKLTVCSDCGKKVYRYGGAKHLGGWACGRESRARKSGRLGDNTLITSIIKILNTVIANPDLLDNDVIETSYSPNQEVICQQNEIRRMMENPTDYERIKSEIYKLAEMKYSCCTYSDIPQKTEKLKSILSQTEQLNTLDIGLLKSCVHRILVSHSCTVEIEFINGVIINERGERT